MKKLVFILGILIFLSTLVMAIPPIRVGDTGQFDVELFDSSGGRVTGCSPTATFYFPSNNYTLYNTSTMQEHPNIPGRYNLTTTFAFNNNGTWSAYVNCTGSTNITDLFLVMNELEFDKYANLTESNSQIISDLSTITTNQNTMTTYLNQILENSTLILGNQTDIKDRLTLMNATAEKILGNLTIDVLANLSTIHTTTSRIDSNISQILGNLSTNQAYLSDINLSTFTINRTTFFMNITQNSMETTINSIKSDTTSILTNSNTIIEYLDCDSVSDSPICDFVSDINTTVTTINTLSKEINTTTGAIFVNISTVIGYVDTLETGQTTIQNYVDTLETGQSQILGNSTIIQGYVDQVEGYVDTLESGQATMTNLLNVINATVTKINQTVNSIQSGATTILSNTNAIIEDLDCDSVSDSPLCDYADDINTTVTNIDVITQEMNITIGSIFVNTSDIIGYVDTLETGQSQILGNSTTIQNYVDTLESGQTTIQNYVDQVEGYVDTLESGQANILTRLQNINDTIISNFTSVFDRLTNINTSVQNVITNTNTIISDIGSLNTTNKENFNWILGNLTNVYNDTQFIRTNMNCTVALENFICERLNYINSTVISSTTINNIESIVTSLKTNMTKVLFYLETSFDKFKILTYEFGIPTEPWEHQYFIRLRGTGVTDTPKISLRVPVNSKEDMSFMKNGDLTYPFDFKRDILGNKYIEFEPILPYCRTTTETDPDVDCPSVEYKILTKNENTKSNLEVYSLASSISSDLENSKIKSFFVLFSDYKLIVYGSLIIIFLMLVFIIAYISQKLKHISGNKFSRKVSVKPIIERKVRKI